MSNSMIRDSIRSRFSTIISEDNSDMEAILLVLQMIRTDQETQYREISQKLDHFLSIQHKPVGNTKAKKGKKTSNSAMEYFQSTYADNQEAYNTMLEEKSVDALMDEYEDFIKDLEGAELLAKKAELIWTHLASKNEKFVEYLGEQIKNSAEEDDTESVAAKKPAKKAPTKPKEPKTTATKSKDTEGAAKSSKPKKSSKKETDVDADAENAEDTQKKKSKKAGSKKTAAVNKPLDLGNADIDEIQAYANAEAENADDTKSSSTVSKKPKKGTSAAKQEIVDDDDDNDLASNLTEDIDDVDEVEPKPKKSASSKTKSKTTDASSTKKPTKPHRSKW